jgi:hypothetical protein
MQGIENLSDTGQDIVSHISQVFLHIGLHSGEGLRHTAPDLVVAQAMATQRLSQQPGVGSPGGLDSIETER